ncbi:hypothetical protein RESH_03143 [Rhodopirellula europaea SH398]|uniref:Uncharacterized protein n=1 Tax=Rhodopirellula europaea SH398 TaxID=1263868 RepID=M5SF82_9BACT|nr:hypothetical protein RESH_03143 [Rhodopirellula europaea SH398]
MDEKIEPVLAVIGHPVAGTTNSLSRAHWNKPTWIAAFCPSISMQSSCLSH